jgi:hypothetical protein
MATIDRSRVDELMSQAAMLDRGPTQLALLEEAVRIADLLGDIELAYDTRTKLIESATFSGAPEKLLVAFSWCLATFDRDPSAFVERTLLWEYKWVIDHLPSFPEVSREQVLGALEDYKRRIDRAGYGHRPVFKLQFRIAEDLGDEESTREAFERWVSSPRSELSDCPACDTQAQVAYFADTGRDQECLDRARPILEGRSRCSTVPHSTYARVLLPLLRLGRLEEAAAYHIKGYRMIAKNRSFLTRASEHLRFLTLTENLAKATKLFTTHLPWALETFDMNDRFQFDLAARLLFERLGESGKKTSRFRLPESFPGFEASGRYNVPALVEWFGSDSETLARRFDARNGNDQYARRIRESLDLGSLVVPYPIQAPGRRKPKDVEE